VKPTRKQRRRERRAAERHGLTLEQYRNRQGHDRHGNSTGWNRAQAWQDRQQEGRP
jgi:hypothetical protein